MGAGDGEEERAGRVLATIEKMRAEQAVGDGAR